MPLLSLIDLPILNRVIISLKWRSWTSCLVILWIWFSSLPSFYSLNISYIDHSVLQISDVSHNLSTIIPPQVKLSPMSCLRKERGSDALVVEICHSDVKNCLMIIQKVNVSSGHTNLDEPAINQAILPLYSLNDSVLLHFHVVVSMCVLGDWTLEGSHCLSPAGISEVDIHVDKLEGIACCTGHMCNADPTALKFILKHNPSTPAPTKLPFSIESPPQDSLIILGIITVLSIPTLLLLFTFCLYKCRRKYRFSLLAQARRREAAMPQTPEGRCVPYSSPPLPPRRRRIPHWFRKTCFNSSGGRSTPQKLHHPSNLPRRSEQAPLWEYCCMHCFSNPSTDETSNGAVTHWLATSANDLDIGRQQGIVKSGPSPLVNTHHSGYSSVHVASPWSNSGSKMSEPMPPCYNNNNFDYRQSNVQQPLLSSRLDGHVQNYFPAHSGASEGASQLTGSPSATQSLASKCEKLSVKAEGRFGAVWCARLHSSNHYQEVALKIFSSQNESSWKTEVNIYELLPPVTTNIKREHNQGCDTDMMARRNILTFLGAEKVSTSASNWEFWLLTEYHPLGSVYDYLKAGHHLTYLQLLNILHGLANGLAFLHDDCWWRGLLTTEMSNDRPSHDVSPSLKHKPSIAHRDLKSKNVLLRNDLTPCIGDMELALHFRSGASFLQEAHVQVGTRRYMAPEVLDGAIQFTRQAFLHIDIYAMALIMWECMSCCRLDGADEQSILTYMLPFDLELQGQPPTMEAMFNCVVARRMRPQPQPYWPHHKGMTSLWRTVCECWDGDAEARLSAGCVAQRISQLLRLKISTTEKGEAEDAV